MWLITAPAIWLASQFGVGKAIALVVSLAVALGAIGGIYAKGYYACASKYELAQANAKLAQVTRERDELKAAQELGEKLAKVMEDAEKSNEALAGPLSGPVAAGTGCVDAPWLRGLAKLQ